jgi:hypothetical protein
MRSNVGSSFVEWCGAWRSALRGSIG